MAWLRSWRCILSAGVCLTVALLAWSASLVAQPTDDLGGLDAKISELWRAGKFADALPFAERYVVASKARFGEASAEHATALYSQATIYSSQSRYDEAEPIYQRVLAIRGKVLGPHHDDVLWTLDALADIYSSTRRAHWAEPVLRRVLAAEERAAKPDQASIAKALQRLAAVEADLKRHGEAEAHMRRALAIAEAGGENAAQMAELLGALAQIERAQGRLEDAALTLNRALKNESRFSRTYVVCEDNRVVAYFCISAGAVERAAAPGRIRRNAPDTIPVSVIGRLAVNL